MNTHARQTYRRPRVATPSERCVTVSVSHRSPVIYAVNFRSRWLVNLVSAFRISRTSPYWLSDHLLFIAMHEAFPRSDYYEFSVTIGLSSRGRSLVPS